MSLWLSELKSPPGDIDFLEQAVQGTTNKVNAGAFERACLTDLINLSEISKWKLANATEPLYQMSDTYAPCLIVQVRFVCSKPIYIIFLL